MMLAFLLLLLSSTLSKDIIPGVESNEAIKRIIDKSSIKVNNAEVCDHTWMYSSNGTCWCGADIRGMIRCSTDPDRVSVLTYSCMTYDDIERVLLLQYVHLDGMVTKTYLQFRVMIHSIM